jgi:putative aldouronate transport system permease protein
MIISSFGDETTLIRNGYSFFPKILSTSAYEYLWQQRESLIRGYIITILVTLIGTAIHLTLATMLSYAISRKEFPARNALAFIVFFTMLFNGGLVPTYLMYVLGFGIKNTLWGLLVPGLMLNAFNVLIMRTYFVTNIPEAVVESAIVDGAGTFRTFRSIALPLSFPILATIGLFAAISYWNDWMNGLIYLTNPKLFSIQNILNRMLTDLRFLQTTKIGSNTSTLYAKIPSTAVRMAVAAVGIIPLLSAYPFFQKYFIKGITIGAVKG